MRIGQLLLDENDAGLLEMSLLIARATAWHEGADCDYLKWFDETLFNLEVAMADAKEVKPRRRRRSRSAA